MTTYDKLGTQMQGVCTAIAVPQWYLNQNLDFVLQHGRTTAGKSVKEVNLGDPADGSLWLTGTLGSLTVQAFVPDAPTKMKFILKFTSGTMDYVETGGIAPKQEQCKIDGLTFGFLVNLSYQDVEDDPTLPQQVRDAVSTLLQYKAGGAFTIQHLFMELQNAAIDKYDPSVTVWSPDMPPAAIAQFPNYLGSYLALLSQAGGDSLGYAITVDQSEDSPATFPPTSLRYMTNRYQDGGAGNAQLDCLLYLMMTDNEDFPKSIQPWWGNLVVPSDKAAGWAGTMAVANRKFVREFLLSRTAPAATEYWRLKNRDGGLDIDYDAAQGTFVPNEMGGHFDSGRQTSRSHQTNSVSNDDVDYAMQVTVDLQVSPGKNLVVIARKTDFDIHFTHWYGLEGHALTSEYHCWYSVPVTYVIDIEGAANGAVQVNVQAQTKPKPTNVVSGDPYPQYFVRAEGSTSTWSAVSDRMDRTITNMVNMAVNEAIPPGLAAAVKDALNLNPFVFPGSNQLFLKDSIFDLAGDILFGLQYNS